MICIGVYHFYELLRYSVRHFIWRRARMSAHQNPFFWDLLDSKHSTEFLFLTEYNTFQLELKKKARSQKNEPLPLVSTTSSLSFPLLNTEKDSGITNEILKYPEAINFENSWRCFHFSHPYSIRHRSDGSESEPVW